MSKSGLRKMSMFSILCISVYALNISAVPALLNGADMDPPLPKSLFWVPMVTNADAAGNFVPGESYPATIKIAPGQVHYNQWNFTNTDYITGDPNHTVETGKWMHPAVFAKAAGFLENAFGPGAGVGLHILKSLDQVQENVEAIQVVPNVVFNDAAPFLATFIIPPMFSKTQTYPIIMSGNWYSQENNNRLFHVESDSTLPCGDDLLVSFAAYARSGETKKGPILVNMNCGGMEAFGIQRESFETVEMIIDSAETWFKADRNQVIWWGRSRGGLTALSWGSNPFNKNYKTIGIFSQAAFPALGTAMTWHPNVMNGFGFAFEKVYGNTMLLNGPIFNGTDFMLRTTGYTSLQEVDNHCGMAMIENALAMGSIAHISMAIGTKDCWQPYYLGQIYHDGVSSAGIHIRSHFQLGGGHEANIKEIMNDIVFFTAGVCGGKTPTEAAEILAPGKFYYAYKNPNFRIYGGIDSLKNVPPTCIPVSVRFPRRMSVGQQTMLEIVGQEGRRVRVMLVDTAAEALINIDTIMPGIDYVLHPFTVNAEGQYFWTVLADDDTLSFTPFNAQPLVLDVGENVTNYNSGDYYDRGFGVDEVKAIDAEYTCPPSAVEDFQRLIADYSVSPVTARMLPGNKLLIRSERTQTAKLESVSIFTPSGQQIGRYSDFELHRGNSSWNVTVDMGFNPVTGTYLIQMDTPKSVYRHKLTITQ